MKFGKEGVPVNVFPSIEPDGGDSVVWYGFICGTPEFPVSDAIQYLKESEAQLPPNDKRMVVTGIDEIEVFHISGHVPICMVRQALHSNRHKKGLTRRPGQKKLRYEGGTEYLGLSQLLKLTDPPELANQELLKATPYVYEALGEERRITSVDLYQCINPTDDSYQMLWRFGVDHC